MEYILLIIVVRIVWAYVTAPERKGIDVEAEILDVLGDGQWWAEQNISPEIDKRFADAGLNAPRIDGRIIRRRAMGLVVERRLQWRLGLPEDRGRIPQSYYRIRPGGRRKADRKRMVWKTTPIPSYTFGALCSFFILLHFQRSIRGF